MFGEAVTFASPGARIQTQQIQLREPRHPQDKTCQRIAVPPSRSGVDVICTGEIDSEPKPPVVDRTRWVMCRNQDKQEPHGLAHGVNGCVPFAKW